MPDASPLGEGLVLLAGGGVGAAILKLAQIWIEKRGSAPSKAKDSADLMAATAGWS